MALLLAVLALVQAAHGALDKLPGDAATTAAGARLGTDQQLVQTQWSEFEVREEDQPEWRAAHPAPPAAEQHNLSEGRPLGTLDAYQQQPGGVAPAAQPYAYPAVPVAAPAVATGGAVPAALLSPAVQPVQAVQATAATRTLLGVELTTETMVGVGVGTAVTMGLGLWLMAAATTAVALTAKAAACCCCVGCCDGCGCEAKKEEYGCEGPCSESCQDCCGPCVYCCCPPNLGACCLPDYECACTACFCPCTEDGKKKGEKETCHCCCNLCGECCHAGKHTINGFMKDDTKGGPDIKNDKVGCCGTDAENGYKCCCCGPCAAKNQDAAAPAAPAAKAPCGAYTPNPKSKFTADCSQATTDGAECALTPNEGYVGGSVKCVNGKYEVDEPTMPEQ